MSKISRAYNSYKDFIIDSFEDYDNWKVTRCYYDGDDYGNYWGYVTIRFYCRDQQEIEDCIDGALGGWLWDGDGEWEWVGKSSVEFSSMIWDADEDQ